MSSRCITTCHGMSDQVCVHRGRATAKAKSERERRGSHTMQDETRTHILHHKRRIGRFHCSHLGRIGLRSQSTIASLNSVRSDQEPAGAGSTVKRILLKLPMAKGDASSALGAAMTASPSTAAITSALRFGRNIRSDSCSRSHRRTPGVSRERRGTRQRRRSSTSSLTLGRGGGGGHR